MIDSKIHLPALDGLRGIAVLLVLIWHYSNFAFPGGIPLTWSGVDLFFVLSGFLLGGILIDNVKSPHYYTAFYVRRFCRIVPLYTILLISFAVLLGSHSEASAELVGQPAPFLSFATFTQNFVMGYRNTFGTAWMVVTWSLAIEEQFYLVLPFVIRAVAPERLSSLLLLMIAGSALLRAAAWPWLSPDHTLSAYVLMPFRADALLSGVLLAWMLRRHPAKIGGMSYAVLLVVFLVGAGWFAVHARTFQSEYMVLFGYTWLALFYSVLLYGVLSGVNPIFKRVLELHWLRGIGQISYGVYLIHLPMVGAVQLALLGHMPMIKDAGDLLVSAVALAATFGLSALSWRYFERPLIELGRRVSYGPRRGLVHPILHCHLPREDGERLATIVPLDR